MRFAPSLLGDGAPRQTRSSRSRRPSVNDLKQDSQAVEPGANASAKGDNRVVNVRLVQLRSDQAHLARVSAVRRMRCGVEAFNSSVLPSLVATSEVALLLSFCGPCR